MSRQYGRVAQLLVGANDGTGLDLSKLRVAFRARNATVATPKEALIRVFNLKEDTARRMREEFTQVSLSAGYEDPGPSLIFRGQIAIVREARDGPDTYVEMLAQDGDQGHNYGVVNKTLAAGWTADNMLDALLEALKPYGIVAGYHPPFLNTQGQRGYAMYGMVSQYLKVLADSQACEWSITDGRLDFIPRKGVLPGTVPRLTSANGLLGVPNQTQDGIVVKCLLRPEIRAGGQIQIDNASIATAQLNSSAFVSAEVPPFFAGLDTDGFYKVIACTHSGDNRGPDWVTEMVCIARDGTAPLGGTQLDAVPDG